MSKTTVAIICGGRSSEHEISCLSAGGVLAGLDAAKFDAVLMGITKEGNWVLLPTNYPLSIFNGVLPSVDEGAKPLVADVHGFSIDGIALDIDVVFLSFMVHSVKMARFKAFLKSPILPTLVAE